jgi:hypothetical protein
VSGFSQGLVDFGQEAKNFNVDNLREQVRGVGERAENAAKLTRDLGEKISLLPDQKTIVLSAPTDEAIAGIDKTKYAIEQIPGTKDFKVIPLTDAATNQVNSWIQQQTGKSVEPVVQPDLTQANLAMQRFRDQWKNMNFVTPVAPPNLPRPPGPPLSPPTATNPFALPPRATGGIFDVWESVASFANGKLPSQATIQNPVSGAGLVQWAEPSTGGEAFIPLNGGARSMKIWAETGRRLMKFETGGLRGPDVLAAQALAGTPYSKGNRTDCSGMAARVIARALGLPESGLMSTKNAAQWLTQAGFQPGIGGPGQISVGWYDHGPNPNDGHMAMTLSDGTHAEAGGKNGVFTLGAAASGADSPQFDQHMFLPTLFGEGAGGGFPGSASSASTGGGGTAGVGPNGEAGTYSAPDAKSVREADEKVADADARVAQAEAKQKELKADAKDSEKQSAQADLDKAKREAADARADAAEVKKGKFTAGKSGGGKGSGDLSEIGSIFGSFLKETTGLDGSLFPDIGNLAPVKMLGTLLGAFGGVGGDQTTSSPFGIPDIAVPAPGTPASGMGMGPLPGPGNNVNIDQSIHGNVGESFDQVQKKREAGLNRALPRIPTGS